MHFFGERGIFFFFAETISPLFLAAKNSNGRKWGNKGARAYVCQLGNPREFFNTSIELSVFQLLAHLQHVTLSTTVWQHPGLRE